MPARLFRVVVPVSDVDAAATFYGALLDTPGRRVAPERHYFDVGDVILACVDPRAHGSPHDDVRPNPDHLYLAVDDLDDLFRRAEALNVAWIEDEITTRPWGERSFYLHDPFGNPLCFVDAATVFRGDD